MVEKMCEWCNRQFEGRGKRTCSTPCRMELLHFERIKFGWQKGPNNSNYGNGQAIAGSKNPNWHGGMEEHRKFVGSTEWKNIRSRIRERDGRCLSCGVKEILSVDHIIPWRVSKDNSDMNLQTLCMPCNSRKQYEDAKKWK